MWLSCFRALHHHLRFNCHLPGKSGAASFPQYTSFTCSGREHFGVSVISFLCAYVPNKALKGIQNTDSCWRNTTLLFIHHRTPKGIGVAVFMLAAWCHYPALLLYSRIKTLQCTLNLCVIVAPLLCWCYNRGVTLSGASRRLGTVCRVQKLSF